MSPPVDRRTTLKWLMGTMAVGQLAACGDQAKGLSWPEVAAEVGTNPGVIARFQKGGRIDGQLMVVASDWAGTPVEALLQPPQPFLGPARMDAGGANRTLPA